MRVKANVSSEEILSKVEECVRYIIDHKDISIEAAMKMYNIRSRYTFYKYLNVIKEKDPNLYNEFCSDRTVVINGKYRKNTVIQAEKFCQYIIDNNTTLNNAAKELHISSTNAYRFLTIVKEVNSDLYNNVEGYVYDKRKDESYLTRQKLDLAEYILMDPEYKTISNAVNKFNVTAQTIYAYVNSLKDIDIELYNKVKEKIHTSRYNSLCKTKSNKHRKEN